MELPITLFIVLFTASVVTPIRWSLVAYLCLSHIDIPDAEGGIGILNVLKGIVLPLYLFWRLRLYGNGDIRSVGVISWLLLVLYVAIAGLWSLFPEASLKIVGHMLGSLVIYLVFIRGVRGGYLTPAVIVPVTIGTLILAVLRSVFLPNYDDEVGRFSSFVTAQSFASFIAALYCVAISSKTLSKLVRLLLVILLAGALVLNGSRIWSVCIVAATLLALVLSDQRTWVKVLIIGILTSGIIVILGRAEPILNIIAQNAESNRIASAITAFFQGDVSSSGLGTLRFRRAINTLAINQIRASSVKDLIVGHGSCNGSNITRSLFGREYARNADPNRMLHNEWLRIIYEWGAVGLVLWMVMISSIVASALSGLRKNLNDFGKALGFYLPGFLFALAGENILAGAGNAVNVGFLLLVAAANGGPKIRCRRLRGRYSNEAVFSSHPLTGGRSGVYAHSKPSHSDSMRSHSVTSPTN